MPGNAPKPRHTVTQPLEESYRFIPLTQGQTTIVDAADFEWLSQWPWVADWNSSTKSFYANRRAMGSKISMHRLILDCLPFEDGDHINHDTLDNRRNNLRKANQTQQAMNRKKRNDSHSPFKGAHHRKDNGTWRAMISVSGNRILLGHFETAVDAARAYDKAAKEFFGEFAYLNFPDK